VNPKVVGSLDDVLREAEELRGGAECNSAADFEAMAKTVVLALKVGQEAFPSWIAKSYVQFVVYLQYCKCKLEKPLSL
jgi:hypothetical protein